MMWTDRYDDLHKFARYMGHGGNRLNILFRYSVASEFDEETNKIVPVKSDNHFRDETWVCWDSIICAIRQSKTRVDDEVLEYDPDEEDIKEN